MARRNAPSGSSRESGESMCLICLDDDPRVETVLGAVSKSRLVTELPVILARGTKPRPGHETSACGQTTARQPDHVESGGVAGMHRGRPGGALLPTHRLPQGWQGAWPAVRPR